jgi:SAM-dependent methyltransferase
MCKYLDILSFKKPGLNILEVGAGTGGTTSVILKALGGLNSDGLKTSSDVMISKYTYTDLSPVFFEGAKEKFGQFEKFMTYKVLNIEEDPTAQGFAGGEYDLIVASNVNSPTSTRLKRRL